MVGLRLAEGQRVPAGASLLRLFPLAAALSSPYLPHHCSACFAPCVHSASLVACLGPCNAAVVYCSSFCSSLDLQLHCDSGECFLLAVCALSGGPGESRLAPVEIPSHDALWRGLTSFPSLGGTCDLRTALRLLAHYEAQHDTFRFLASRTKNDSCRLGALMSNRSALLQSSENALSLDVPAMHVTNLRPREVLSPHGTTEIDEDAQELARELREAALLMCFARCLRVQSGTVASRRQMTREDEIFLAEEVICQVFTNGVQVLVDELEQSDSILAKGGSYLVAADLGTAVYGPLFSWFNHSCRPNAFYRFGREDPRTHENSFPRELEATVAPDMDITDVTEAWGLESCRTPWSRSATLVTNQMPLQLKSVMDLR